MESNNSVPVTASADAKPIGPSAEKKVGFSRPTLIIPPPRVQLNPPTSYLSVPIGSPHVSYGRKTSKFMFDHIHQLRDLGLSTAKTSLGFGEKCAYWFYNKVKVLSKKWFTHCFLTIVLIIYTIGGAASFKAIEEPYEGSVQRLDMIELRYKLINRVTNLSILLLPKNETDKWTEEVTKQVSEFILKVIEDRRIEAFIEANRGDKVWTWWNTIVFCATIYTTIGISMFSFDKNHVALLILIKKLVESVKSVRKTPRHLPH